MPGLGGGAGCGNRDVKHERVVRIGLQEHRGDAGGSEDAEDGPNGAEGSESVRAKDYGQRVVLPDAGLKPGKELGNRIPLMVDEDGPVGLKGNEQGQIRIQLRRSALQPREHDWRTVGGGWTRPPAEDKEEEHRQE